MAMRRLRTPPRPAMPRLRITLVKSAIGYERDQKATVKALGLRRIRHTVEKEDNPTIRGMVRKVRHLVELQEL
jgi:large subunit ribosomal protein L30